MHEIRPRPDSARSAAGPVDTTPDNPSARLPAAAGVLEIETDTTQLSSVAARLTSVNMRGAAP